MMIAREGELFNKLFSVHVPEHLAIFFFTICELLKWLFLNKDKMMHEHELITVVKNVKFL